ncbi:carotenoid biosynthesis protein [Cytobacillus spongiae]|jgi:putative membrane protein|uniref:carotenoid biosynthesis protein n=1 Tax=Cytobacillus spongiae TaxID=2901381 RepID=UPI001F2AB0FA|nr:carotenoid biosynthesis protein [Cytobacillus spongiae]UII55488.1 carotenoid biosynthesis protein [Cytobacillus spongiae]
MKLDDFIYKWFLIWYVCGVVLLSFDLLPPWLEWSNAVFLILAGLLAAIFFYKVFGNRIGISLIFIIFCFSFVAEYLGATHGILFGEYRYTSAFDPRLWDVPIGIGFAWLMVMGTSHVLAKRIMPNSKLLYAFLGGMIAVIIDLIIDPVAYQVKGYWIWEEPGFYYHIPFSNFVGWFVVAFLLHLVIISFSERAQPNPLWEKRMGILFILMISMFVLLGIIGKLWLASALTTLLAALVIYFAVKGRLSND